MDLVSLAITSAVSKLAEAVIRDAFDTLKKSIEHRVGKKSKLAQAVNDLEDNPQSSARKEVLIEEVVLAKAHKDEQIRKYAERLLTSLKSVAGGADCIENVQSVYGDKNAIAGSFGTATVNIGPYSRELED